MDPVTDSNIGRYRRLFEVGRGSFATVYGGYDDALGTAVALKVLHARHAADPDVRSRFVNEARLLREATSPHLVRVHDLRETDDGRPYMVLDFADRGTVATRIASLRAAGHTPSRVEIATFARQVGDGVAAIHDRLRVVHRDLKPSNLLLTTHSTLEPVEATTAEAAYHDALIAPDEVLLVADFGLARELDRSSLTVSAGTLGYMAPEQLQPGKPVTQATDLYALTAIVHELVVGHAPGALGFDAAVNAPAWVTPFLATGLAVDPGRRHRSARDWADELVTAASDGGDGSRRFTRRTVLAGAGAAAVVAGVGGTIALVGREGGAADGTPTATAPVELVAPQRLAADGNGGVVVADAQQVVAIAADGTATRLAGTGVRGTGGAGPATAVSLTEVTGVAPGGAAGEWLIADAGSGVVYRLTTAGQLEVVDRTFNRPADVLADGADLVVVDLDTNTVFRALDGGSDVEELAFDAPASIAVDLDGRLVVADAGTTSLHLLDATTEEVIDLSSSPINSISGIAVFRNGYLVADPTGNRVWRVDGLDQVEPFAGNGAADGPPGDGGPATDAPLAEPIDVAVDATGSVFVLEGASRAVRVVDPDGRISTLARPAAQPA